jgi:hypothetical protein
MKGHFLFNTWTTGTMLAGLIDAVDRDDDLVILDRGVFDALIWLEAQRLQGQVSESERNAFEKFVLVERWRSLIDVTCTVTVEPAVSMARENERRLLPRSGSVMNTRALPQFNAALRRLIERHRNQFNFVALTNSGTVHEGATNLIRKLLRLASDWADPEIAVVSRPDACRLVPSEVRPWTSDIWRSLARVVEFRKRSVVEDDDGWVQVLACGAQVFEGGVFLSIRRRQRGQLPSSRDDSARIWQGCHTRKPDNGRFALKAMQRQLLDRLREDLHLGELNADPEPLGLIWTPKDTERRHLGVSSRFRLRLASLSSWTRRNFERTVGDTAERAAFLGRRS